MPIDSRNGAIELLIANIQGKRYFLVICFLVLLKLGDGLLFVEVSVLLFNSFFVLNIMPIMYWSSYFVLIFEHFTVLMQQCYRSIAC